MHCCHLDDYAPSIKVHALMLLGVSDKVIIAILQRSRTSCSISSGVIRRLEGTRWVALLAATAACFSLDWRTSTFRTL